jgi:glycosyltransferase involved in cell wall biosynthesis
LPYPLTKTVSVVICTRNRSRSLSRLLGCKGFESNRVGHVIVVDSSSSSSEAERNSDLVAGFSQGVLLLSSPGLPRQRNVGTAYLAENLGLGPNEVICYLDDDVTIPDDYFEQVLSLLSGQSVIAGAWDISLPDIPDSRLRRILSHLELVSSSYFSISRAGATTAGKIQADLQEVDWVPGHSFSMRLETWLNCRFNDKIRMTGEDLEFQLRARPISLVMSRFLTVEHHREALGRGSAGRVAYEEALFRLFLSNRYPSKIQARKVLLLNFALGIHAGLSGKGVRAALALFWASVQYVCLRPLHRRVLMKLGFGL